MLSPAQLSSNKLSEEEKTIEVYVLLFYYSVQSRGRVEEMRKTKHTHFTIAICTFVC